MEKEKVCKVCPFRKTTKVCRYEKMTSFPQGCTGMDETKEFFMPCLKDSCEAYDSEKGLCKMFH